MAKSKQAKGPVGEEYTLEFTTDGKAASWWWTPEADHVLLTLGSPTAGYEAVNPNQWCG